MRNIKPYRLIKSEVNGLPFYHYLHIRGGSGDWGKDARYRNGGEFNFIAYYASPELMEGCNMCERLWCIEKNIPYGEGDTIEDALKMLNRIVTVQECDATKVK